MCQYADGSFFPHQPHDVARASPAAIEHIRQKITASRTRQSCARASVSRNRVCRPAAAPAEVPYETVTSPIILDAEVASIIVGAVRVCFHAAALHIWHLHLGL